MATFGTTIGSGGFRFYDANHEVSYNYVEGVYGGNFQGPLLLDSGDAEGSSTALDAHWRVVNALVERNVLLDNPEGIRFGHNYSLAPTGCTVRDNLVAAAETGAAVTQRIAPVSTTQTSNSYGSTPAAVSLTQGGDTIWRRANYGPRLTYLQPADVGINGDLADSDGTGVLVGSNGGGGGPVVPVDQTTAAGRLSWGAPLDISDEFGYTGSPNSSKWSIYNGVGHDGNGQRLPSRVTVDGSKLVGTGLANGDSFGMAHKLDQQYGRWEVRMRAFTTGGGTGTTQTLGVGGIATPSGAILASGDSTSALTITASGTSTTPRVYDGQGRTIGRVTFDNCQYVVVQNYRIQSGNQYGVVFDDANNCTLQNCDISNVRVSGDGDLNAITVWGGNANKIRYNTAVNYVSGDPGDSHTDCIQTWVSSSHPNAATNYEVIGNRFIGPANPSRSNSIPSIHQIIMVEGAGRGGNSGGSGNPSGWFVAENEFGDSWNQAVKLDGGTNFTFTRNRFVGSSDKCFDLPLASGYKIYSDNQFGSEYSSIGGTITAGAGPATPGGSTGGTAGGNYHPVMIIWPTSERWPEDGEYDFVELSTPGQQSLTAFMHYPHDPGAVQQIQFSKAGVDTSVFHNYAFEWTPDYVKGFVDGVEWFTASGGATSTRRAMQTMPSGHLTIQLDNFNGTTQIPATMEVEWARVYTLTPSGGSAGSQTISPVGIFSREALSLPQVYGNQTAPSNSVPTILGQNLTLGSGTLTWTLTDGPPDPSGSATVAGAGKILTGQAFGRPELTVDPGDQIVAPTPIPTAFAAGRPVMTGGTPPPAAPSGTLVPALYAVERDGTTLVPLTAWTSIKLSPVRNSAGSLEVTYPAGAPGFDLLHDGVSASPLRALEIRVWIGGNNTAALGGWLVQKSGDALTPGDTWTFTGHFHEWLLTKALVFPQAISEANKTGALSFAGATAGLIFTTVMDQAQARGALPLVTRDFTSTHDSNGVAWAKGISSLKFAPKTTVAQIADKLVELGMCEYELTQARVWRAYNPGGRGLDRTTGIAPLTFAHAVNLREHSRRESSRDAGTAVLVAGAEGFYETASSATAQAELGWRAEVGIDAGQLNSRAAVQAVTPSYLETARAGVAEYASGVVFGSGLPLPLIDYGVGDWGLARVGATFKRLRIAQIELVFAQGAPPQGTVTQNDLITDKLAALYKRLNAISTGDAVVGTSESTPGGTGDDTMPPAAPLGVTVASVLAFQVPGDFTTRALVEVGWAAVTTNAYVDQATADKASAVASIANWINNGRTVSQTDLTWGGCPPLVTTYGKEIYDEWKASPDGVDDLLGRTFESVILPWLTGWPGTHQGGGSITDDVANYKVQYSYLGASVVTAPRIPDQGESLPDVGWIEPDESPSATTRLTFEAQGGRAVGVRVAAVDRAGNQGPWSAVVGVLTAVDDVPPPAPSKPIVTAWFETMNVTWDGKGSAGEDLFTAAPDIASGGLIEVHVGLGINFTPDRPIGADGRTVDLAASSTYRTDMQWAGTTNITDLTLGVTYYVRLVAVDRNGNASDPSETSDGVLAKKLVNIQFGPDAIERLQIRNGAIGSAEIDQLAVNDIHVSNVSVGKLTAGTMLANVIIGGRFETPLTNGNQIQLDAQGLRLYRNNTVIGRWQVSDSSMLMTGQFNSALTGQRVVINPGGSNPDTIRLYPSFSDSFSSVDSVDFNGGAIAGIRIVGSGTASTSNRGMLIIRDQYASLVHGRTDLSYWGSEIWVEQNFTRNKSATVDLVVDERLTPIGGERRVAMIHYDSSGFPINATGLYYKKTAFNGGEPFLYGNGQDVGLVFGGGRLVVSNNPNNQRRGIIAGSFTVESSREVKYGFRDLDGDPTEYLRSIAPQHFKLKAEPADQSEKLGFIAEEMPVAVQESTFIPSTDGQSDRTILGLDYQAITALLWAATKRIDERVVALENTHSEQRSPGAEPS